MLVRSSSFRRNAGVSVIVSLLFGFHASPASAGDPLPLTRERIAELVQTAPASRVAEADVAVSAAAVTSAGVLSRDNPVVSGLGGYRFNPDGGRSFSGVAGLSFPVDIAGQRGARIEAAEADLRAARASGGDAVRRVLIEALLRHARVLRDERQLAVAAARRALSQRLFAAAQKRRTAGSVPELDVVLVALQQSRDTSAEVSARGTLDADTLSLAALLGIPERPPVEGPLVPSDDVPALATLIGEVGQRTDVRAAEAALDAARARASRERAHRFPTLNVLAQYTRDDGADVAQLGLSVPIPILNANRAEVATSAAEAQAASARLTVARAAAEGQLRELYARHEATKAARDALAPTAALAKQAADLATRGYELGEDDLASVLLVRRESIEAEAALLEADHDHAAATIELLVTAGRTVR